jgi:hypothetical protein
MPELALGDVLATLGFPPGSDPPRPVIYGSAGTLVSFGIPVDGGRPEWTGAWIAGDEVTFLGPEPAPAHAAAFFSITGTAARLLARFARMGHETLERIEELDEALVSLQDKPQVPIRALWPLRQRTSVLRTQIDRALVAASMCEGPFNARFPGFDKVWPTVEDELLRLQRLAAGLQQTISDLLVARNVEESNRIAEAANDLARTSNRLAALGNSSNIRMLGLTYLALFLALASAVILFPNTGATILGMPSAAWVPGVWVIVSLVALAVIPLVWVYTRPWVRSILADLRNYEQVAKEGLQQLPEVSPESVARTRPASK